MRQGRCKLFLLFSNFKIRTGTRPLALYFHLLCSVLFSCPLLPSFLSLSSRLSFFGCCVYSPIFIAPLLSSFLSRGFHSFSHALGTYIRLCRDWLRLGSWRISSVMYDIQGKKKVRWPKMKQDPETRWFLDRWLLGIFSLHVFRTTTRNRREKKNTIHVAMMMMTTTMIIT